MYHLTIVSKDFPRPFNPLDSVWRVKVYTKTLYQATVVEKQCCYLSLLRFDVGSSLTSYRTSHLVDSQLLIPNTFYPAKAR